MFLKRLRNFKSGQIMTDEVLRWILWIMLFVAAGIVIKTIIGKFA